MLLYRADDFFRKPSVTLNGEKFHKKRRNKIVMIRHILLYKSAGTKKRIKIKSVPKTEENLINAIDATKTLHSIIKLRRKFWKETLCPFLKVITTPVKI